MQLFIIDYARVEILPTPVLQFGGKQGRNVTVVVFQKLK